MNGFNVHTRQAYIIIFHWKEWCILSDYIQSNPSIETELEFFFFFIKVSAATTTLPPKSYWFWKLKKNAKQAKNAHVLALIEYIDTERPVIIGLSFSNYRQMNSYLLNGRWILQHRLNASQLFAFDDCVQWL